MIKIKTENHGKWVYGEFDLPHCSECGYEVMPDEITPICKKCGAIMEEDNLEEMKIKPLSELFGEII